MKNAVVYLMMMLVQLAMSVSVDKMSTLKEPIRLNQVQKSAKENIIHYDGNNILGIGSGQLDTLEAAIRLTSEELQNYYGKKISSIMFYARGYNGFPLWSKVRVKIYKGGNELAPGAEIYRQDVSNVAVSGWTTVSIPGNSLVLETQESYWVSYEMVTTEGYPLGISAGPSVPGKSQWLREKNEWHELKNISSQMDFNWNIRVGVDELVVQDTDAPLFVALSDTLADINEPIKVMLSLADKSGIGSVTGQYKLEGQNSYTEFQLSACKGEYTYTGTIPASDKVISGSVRFIAKDATPAQNILNTGEHKIKWLDPAECVNYDFEAGVPDGWLNMDADGDGKKWTICSGFAAHSGVRSISSASFDYNTNQPLKPDNLLITDQLTIGKNAFVKFMVNAQCNIYTAEKFGLGAATSVIDTSSFNMLLTKTLRQGGWQEFTVDLSAYEGKKIFLAFRHWSCTDQFAINLDDVSIYGIKNTSIENNAAKLKSIELSSYPNPFNPVSTINFTLQNDESVELNVYNSNGNLVQTLVNRNLAAGSHQYQFNASGLNSGVYFLKMKAGRAVISQKMLLVK